MLNRSFIWWIIRSGWMPSRNLDFKVISGVIKVNEVIIGKMSVCMQSEEHNFGKLRSNITKSLFSFHYII